MKINGYTPISGLPKNYHDIAKKNQISGATPAGSDKLEITENSKAIFAEAVKAAKMAPDIRVDLVAEKKMQVENGTYKPDSSLIAEAMLKRITL